MRDPWSQIPASSQRDADNVRRADAEHPLDFSFGRDFSGRYLFSLSGPPPLPGEAKMPRLSGIEVSFEQGAERGWLLVLTLLNRKDSDVFRALCRDIMAATRHIGRGDTAIGLKLVLERLHRWQELLQRRKDDLLSQKEIIGLVGELLFLRDCLLPLVPASIAIGSWRGPYGDEQDFALGGVIFEVKTQLATSPEVISIASAEQLDTSSGDIFICHQTVTPTAPGSGTGSSLNSLADELAAATGSDEDAAALLADGLLAAGYLRRTEYDAPAWMLGERSLYAVTADFPRIVPSMLQPGVEKVRYQVRIETCVDFQTDLDEALKRATNGKD